MCEREVTLYMITALRTRQSCEFVDLHGCLCAIARCDEKAGFSVANNLLRRSTPKSDYRRSACHCFNRRQAKRFVPGNREEQPQRLPHHPPQLCMLQLPQISHTLSRLFDPGSDPLRVILLIINPARNQQPAARSLGNLNGGTNPFFGSN